jgi:imidazolonepropionase-like amidohydrolase
LGKEIKYIEEGKFADIVVASRDPLVDITEMERAKFVMKDGVEFRKKLK